MSIYKELYIKLFRQLSQTIEELKQLQQECEKMYIDDEPPPPIHLREKQGDDSLRHVKAPENIPAEEFSAKK